ALSSAPRPATSRPASRAVRGRLRRMGPPGEVRVLREGYTPRRRAGVGAAPSTGITREDGESYRRRGPQADEAASGGTGGPPAKSLRRRVKLVNPVTVPLQLTASRWRRRPVGARVRRPAWSAPPPTAAPVLRAASGVASTASGRGGFVQPA